MGQLNFKPRTLDDEIIRDGLCAVSTLEDRPASRGKVFLVGGIATQSYLPSSCRRPTSDIDFAVLRPLGQTDFREFSKPAVEYLESKGYTAQLKKGHTSHQIIFSYKGENTDDAAVIEFARKGEANFQRIATRLEREIQNTRRKIVEGRDSSYNVSSPEDIVVPKIVRGIGALERNHLLCGYIQDAKPIQLSNEEIQKQMESIRDLREQATIHVGDVALTEEVRFISDIFDIRLLAELTGFNKPYLVEVMGSWDKISKPKCPARDLLVNYLFPRMDITFNSKKVIFHSD